MQILEDFGLGERFRGLGEAEADRDLWERLYRSLECELELLLSLEDGEGDLLLLLLLLLLLGFASDVSIFFSGVGLGEREGLLADGFTGCLTSFLAGLAGLAGLVGLLLAVEEAEEDQEEEREDREEEEDADELEREAALELLPDELRGREGEGKGGEGEGKGT